MSQIPLSLGERVSASLGIVRSLLRKTLTDTIARSGLTTLQRVLERGELAKSEIDAYSLRMRPGGDTAG